MVFNSLIVQVARPRDQLVLYVPLRPACCAHHQPVPSSPFVLPCCIRLHDDAKDPLALPWRRDPSSRRRFAIPVHPSASTNPLTPHKKKETYDLFAHSLPSHSLGFIDPKAPTLDLTIAGRDLVIHQSPGILSSNRAGGTTGAGTYPPSPHPTPTNPNYPPPTVLWKITPLFAAWLSSPTSPLFHHALLTPTSYVLELGCGISALVGLLTAPRISRYVLTDQPYVAKLVEANIVENDITAVAPKRGGGKHKPPSKPVGRDKKLVFAPLDWELTTPTASLTSSPTTRSFDAVVACDCIYNEALIEPFVAACRDVCRLREGEEGKEPTVCVVGQQLRDPEIFEAWLEAFGRAFRVWRVPGAVLGEGMGEGSVFVVHVGVLR